MEFVLGDISITCFLLSSLCGGCLCSGGSSGTASVDFVLNDDSKTMLFVFSCLVCAAAVCAVGVLVFSGLVAWIVCWRMFLKLCCFLFPNVC